MERMRSGDRRIHDSALFDALTEQGPARRSFLRAAWFDAATPAPDRFVLADKLGAPLAGLALNERRKGPLTLREVAGGYWPFRGVPLARDVQAAPLARALGDHRERLGRIWRLGPVEAGDPSLEMLSAAARMAGWRMLSRPLGRVFELDLAALGAQGDWPSAKTKRKNRWRKRRLEEESGPLRVEFFTGTDWTPAQRDAMAQVEAASWLGQLDHGGDTKFRNPAMRGYWEALCVDPQLAAILFGSLMWLGDTPAAFTFGVQAGDVRYYIANNYDQRFTQFGPGRVLLYDDFAHAAEHGVTRISWGLGDAGYKSEMGAQPGPEMVDLLFVRGALLSRLLSPWWERAA